MRFALASLLLAHLAVAYARPLMASTSSSFSSRKHVDSDESKVVDTSVSRLNPRSPVFWKEEGKPWRGKKVLDSTGLGHTRDQPPLPQPPQSESQPSQSQPPQLQPPNGPKRKGRGRRLLNFVGLDRTREQSSQSEPPNGKGKGRGRRFLDFIGSVGRTRKQPSHSEPPQSESPRSESPHPESPQSETPQSQSPQPQSPQSQLLQHGSNTTAASPKAHFEDDPVSRIRRLPHWHTAFLNFTPLVAEHVNVFITFTGSTAGTDADADKYSREDAGFMYARLRQWALVKLGDQFPRVSKMMYIPADKKLGTGSVWKLERIVDPISFEYWFDWDVAKGVKRPAYLPEYRNGDEFSFPGFDVQLEDHEEVYLETSDFLRRYHGIDL
ncbi:hypothetical protein EV361DRAFT_966140 [Lentinula raphanica]|uniref:Uncharacterized protein n=1 Tax=Lentinula raphanica TaxID=153919 RepID=A0AA38UIW8_9AGAR|nr:hypothetical protein F5878DRAFT_709049 [Lentinula raphanica]KAJ3966521.1 hypothetical protein EV361DRAFT_966140 [Lentinula raphanica]